MQHCGQCAIGIALAKQRARENAPHACSVGLQRQHALQRVGGFPAAALGVERKPQVRQRTRPVRIDRQRGARRVLGVRVSSERHQDSGTRLMQRSVVSDERNRVIERFERRGRIAELLEENGKQAVRRRVRRLPRNQNAQRRDSIGKAAGLGETQRSLHRHGR